MKKINNLANNITTTTTTDNNSADNSVAIGAIKHISDRVKANNQVLKLFYKDCKLVDRLPIDNHLKEKIVCQLMATIRDCFQSLVESI